MKTTITLMLLACAMFVSAALYAADKPTTWQGTLVDSNCYLKDNSLTGNDHMGVKECGTTCLKSGLPAGLLTKEKVYHVLVAPAPALAPYVGQEVQVTGSLHSGAILADKVEVRKNGGWQEIQLKSMM